MKKKHNKLHRFRKTFFPLKESRDMKGFLIITICLVASTSLISYAYNAYVVTNKLVVENISKEEEETKISHILFGIAGSAKTWNNRSRYSELWSRPNVTRGSVWLVEKPQKNKSCPNTFPPYKVSEDTSSFKYTC